MSDVILITDGSADNGTGTGGWCAITRTPSVVVELTGHASNTTSNRMEMTAVIEGLRSIKIPSTVDLIADSAYVLNSLKKEWYKEWIYNEPHRTKPRPNLDLWQELAGLVQFHQVSYYKVKGHSGDFWNTRADKLAGEARKNKLEICSRFPNFDSTCLLPFTTIPITQPLTV